MQPRAREALAVYADRLQTQGATMLGIALATAVLCLVLRYAARRFPNPRGWTWASRLTLGVALGVGGYFAYQRAACFDDAYVSFRYAQNLVEGRGLVWNVGERVEGYTNFLWTIAVAAGIALTAVEAPLIGMALAFVCYVANVLVVHRIAARVSEPGTVAWPLAAVLVALQQVVIDYATSGLETQCASLLVNLGLLSLCGPATPRQRALAGLWLILATLTRPDHALFYAAGAATVVGVDLLAARDDGRQGDVPWSARLRRMLPGWLSYAAPFALYLAHLGFRLSYYGQWFPNTYYAKLAGSAHFAQGQLYALVFHLGSHFWLLLPLALGFGAFGPARARALRIFVPLSIAAYNFYIVRVGGDFMEGRFYVSLIPLYVLGAALLARQLMRRWPWAGVLACALLAATVHGARLISGGQVRWHIADEAAHYQVEQWQPVVIKHYTYNVAQVLAGLQRAGAEPVVAATTVGMVGYYASRLPIIDRFGLTDHTIARMPPQKRRRIRPGHVPRRVRPYLLQRGVDIGRREPPPLRAHHALARIHLGKQTGGRHWYLMRYRRALVAAMRAADPDIRVRDFERYLDDYIEGLLRGRRPKPERLAADLAFFDSYYFDHNDDADRRARLQAALERSASAEPGR